MSDTVVIADPPESACGHVQPGGTYLRGVGGGGWGGGGGGVLMLGTAIWPARGDASGVVTKATKRSTPRVVDAAAILANAPERDWLVAQSKTNWLNNNWQKFDQHALGMPARERLDNGILAGVTSIEEAAAMLQALTFNGHRASIGKRLEILAHITVTDQRLHPVSLEAWRAFKAGHPYLVLARLHDLLNRHPGMDAADAAYAVMELIAPEDMFWRQLQKEIDL